MNPRDRMMSARCKSMQVSNSAWMKQSNDEKGATISQGGRSPLRPPTKPLPTPNRGDKPTPPPTKPAAAHSPLQRTVSSPMRKMNGVVASTPPSGRGGSTIQRGGVRARGESFGSHPVPTPISPLPPPQENGVIYSAMSDTPERGEGDEKSFGMSKRVSMALQFSIAQQLQMARSPSFGAGSVDELTDNDSPRSNASFPDSPALGAQESSASTGPTLSSLANPTGSSDFKEEDLAKDEPSENENVETGSILAKKQETFHSLAQWMSNRPAIEDVAKFSGGALVVTTTSALERSQSNKKGPPPAPPRGIFGQTLQTIYSKGAGNSVPIPVLQCIDYLMSTDAIKTEGLFRVSGNQNTVFRLRAAYRTAQSKVVTLSYKRT